MVNLDFFAEINSKDCDEIKKMLKKNFKNFLTQYFLYDTLRA